MSWILNNILNQKGSPAIYTDDLANRPAAGYTGRLFVAKDTFAWYRDNGSGWDLIGGPGSGTITGTLTANRVAYATGSNTIGTSANLLFDGTTFTTVNDIVVNGLFIGKGGGNIITNQAFGINALVANTTGYTNLSIGSSALKANTTGFQNIAIGNNALEFGLATYANIAIGSMALNENQSGYYNIAIGRNALLKNSTAYTNIAIGDGALRQTTTGPSNVAIGNDALFTNIIGGNNTAIGVNAGSHVIGSSNIMIGINAGNDNSLNGNTNNSVFIGNSTKPNNFGQTNQIVIGDQTTGNGSNTVTIGNSSIVNTYLQGAVNFSTGVITKTSSGIALSITDSANGNALNINKTGSGFAINVAAGVSSFSDTVLIQAVDDFVSSLRIGGGRVRLETLYVDQGECIIERNVPILQFNDLSSGINGIMYNVAGTLRLTNQGGTTPPLSYNITNGKVSVGDSFKTADPTGGTAAEWKMGSYVAVAAPAPTGYIEIDIAGTLYKIAAGT
jgi:hypothetical protein